MSVLKKITNWATGNSISFEKENEVYEEIVKDINNINNLLDDLILDDEMMLRYNQLSIKSMRNFQKIKIQSSSHAKMTSERNDILQEIKLLEIEIQKLVEELKDKMLQDMELYEVQEIISSINYTIYHNIHMPAFESFIGENMMDKKWNQLQLNELRNSIAIRRQTLIPQLVDINKRR